MIFDVLLGRVEPIAEPAPEESIQQVLHVGPVDGKALCGSAWAVKPMTPGEWYDAHVCHVCIDLVRSQRPDCHTLNIDPAWDTSGRFTRRMAL